MNIRRTLGDALFLALLAATLPAAEPEIVATISIPSIETVAADLQHIGQALMMPRLGSSVTNMLVRVLGPAAVSQIDLSKSADVYVLIRRIESSDGAGNALIAPLFVHAAQLSEKPDALLEALEGLYGLHDKDGAVHRFSQPKAPTQGTPPLLFVATPASRVLAGNDADAVRAVLAMTHQSSRVDSLAGCSVIADIDVPACMPFVGSKLERMSRMMGNPAARAAGPETGPAGDAKAALGFLGEMKALTVGLAAIDNAVEVRTRVQPRPGTSLSRVVGSLREPPSRCLRVLPPDALLAVAGSDLGGAWINSPSAALPGLGGSAGPSETGTSPVFDLFTGEYCVGIAPRPEDSGLGMVQIYGSSDPGASLAALRNALDRCVQTGGDPTSGLTVKSLPSRTRKGVEVFRYICSTSTSTRGALGGAAGILSQFCPFGIELTASQSDVIHTLGPPSVMNHTLDRIERPGASIAESPGFKGLFPAVPEKAVKVHRIQPVRLLKALLGALPDVSADMLALIPNGTGGIAGYGYTDGVDAISVTRIACDELAGLRGGLLLAGSLMAQSVMSGLQPAAAARPQSGVARCSANLRRLSAAKEQYSLECGLADGDDLPVDKLLKYLPGGELPLCPGGGTYTIGTVGEPARCSLPSHQVK